MKNKSALILIDLQNDFCQGGTMGVRDTDSLIDSINHLQTKFDLVVATKDWHPANHISFAANHSGLAVGDSVMVSDFSQALWPVHCVQDTYGAAFHSELNSDSIQETFMKGANKGIDSYSAFFDNNHSQSTGLDVYLREKDVENVYIAGLVTEYCVKYSVLDAIECGFNTYLVPDCCRAVNLTPDAAQLAIEEVQAAGAKIVKSKDI